MFLFAFITWRRRLDIKVERFLQISSKLSLLQIFNNAVNFGKVLAFYFSWFYTNSQLGLGQDCFPTNPAPVHSYHLSISLPILTSGKEWSLVEKCWFCEFASSWADGLVGCSYTELYSWSCIKVERTTFSTFGWDTTPSHNPRWFYYRLLCKMLVKSVSFSQSSSNGWLEKVVNLDHH